MYAHVYIFPLIVQFGLCCSVLQCVAVCCSVLQSVEDILSIHKYIFLYMYINRLLWGVEEV